MLCSDQKATFKCKSWSCTQSMIVVQIINYLRFGCTPVGVLDGEAPEEKVATLQAR